MGDVVLITRPKLNYDERITEAGLRDLIPSIVSSLPSVHSQRAYQRQMSEFMNSGLELNQQGVGTFIGRLQSAKKAPQTINQARAILQRFARDAEHAGLIDRHALTGVERVARTKKQGIRFGRWLTHEGARKFYYNPNRETVEGMRDAACLALTLGCGLRREEASEITWNHYREVKGRMCLVDVMGKGRKLRTIPVAPWAQADLDLWKAKMESLPVSRGVILEHLYALRRIGRGQKVAQAQRLGGKLTAKGVWWIVKKHAAQIGVSVAPHDLRRTLAQLMHRSGADLDQIQYVLGHENIQTTMHYLGGAIELLPGKAAVDQVKF